jgi:hypothetical protein
LIKHSGERFGATTKDANGRAVPAVASPFTFKGTYPQPAGENDLKALTEGSTPSSAIVIHSVQRLNITEGGKKGDVIIWEGERYLVMQSNRRNHLAGNYRNLLRKVQAGE